MNKLHQADVRSKIQASQLINLLQKHALEGVKDFDPTRMKAIEILLKKSLPDLTSIEHTGEGGGPIDHNLAVQFVGVK
jgi:hypothetical protein